MSAYFFDLIDGDSVSEDNSGAEYAGLEEARREATSRLLKVAQDLLPDSAEERELSIRVRDAQQDQVLEVSLAFRIHAAPGSEFPQ